LKLNCGLKVDAKALGVELVSFDEALATADFISLHMPLIRFSTTRASESARRVSASSTWSEEV
jgi:hypothetical protein